MHAFTPAGPASHHPRSTSAENLCLYILAHANTGITPALRDEIKTMGWEVVDLPEQSPQAPPATVWGDRLHRRRRRGALRRGGVATHRAERHHRVDALRLASAVAKCEPEPARATHERRPSLTQGPS
jgi:hypothetical protein